MEEGPHESNPARRAWPRAVGFVVLGAGLGGLGVWLALRTLAPLGSSPQAAPAHGPQSEAQPKEQYICPMHPTITSDHPGDCPICGMKLVKVAADAQGNASAPAPDPVAAAPSATPSDMHGEAPKPTTRHVRKIAFYRSPMDPKQTSPVPRKDGMGMDYVPVYKDVVIVEQPKPPKLPWPESGSAPQTAAQRKLAFYRSPMDPKQTSPVPRKDEMGMDYVPVYEDEVRGGGAQVDGRMTVQIDPARQQMIGLRTAPVTRGDVGGSWRTVGRVEVDPTRVRKTNVKVDGYVERIFVNFPGQHVRKGEPLFTLYSPTLLAAQHEYVAALAAKSAAGAQGSAEYDALLTAARRRMQLWDVSDSAMAELESTRKVGKTLTFDSPISGVVTVKNVVEGSHLNPGDTPYEITDLSMVWVMVDAYESDIARVHVGMEATLTLPAYANRVFRGRVQFIDPLLDANTRTVKVHMHFPNPTGELKPELYGEVILSGETRQGLLVPLDAVIHSGTKAVVFVALDQGKFRPVEVQLGQRSGDQVEVVSGLSEGQSVVTRANFLVDSESQLRASLADLAGK
jgi:Cu(I)/Ag(I) efflux system membrane fusion protein